MPHHNLLIIGTGSGNSLITPELEGLDIAIVEEGRFGGTCLNVGCIPTKMYVLPADRIVEARESDRLGVTFPKPTVNWPAIRDRIFGRIDPIASGGEAYRRSQDFVTVYAATARFVGDRTVALSTGGQVSADRIVVAAGSRANGLPVDGLREPDTSRGLHTSDTIMRLDTLPKRMAIVGGGFVGCEFAHVFSALGVEVTQIQRSATVLSKEEAEVAKRYTALAGERYDLRVSTGVNAAHRTEAGELAPEHERVVLAHAAFHAARGVQDEQVEAAEGLLHLRHHVGDGCLVGQIRLHDEHFDAQFAQLCGELLGAGGLVAEVDDDVRTGLREIGDGVGTDPPR